MALPICASGDQYFAVVEKRSRVSGSRVVQARGRGKLICLWIVNFGAGEDPAVASGSAHDQDASIGKHGSCMVRARLGHLAGESPLAIQQVVGLAESRA